MENTFFYCMHKNGIPIEVSAKFTDLRIEEIRNILKKIELLIATACVAIFS
ncbi:hypothetical protein [Bacillus thuringiensis]|uniref:hypothetical protein n=1 Tax=Bacillus thuringiensis TaxID=1428 RepID=UPI0003D332E7|nr:hypothetical protein C621_0216325 [Bacillus thuringiensis serovar aizawai str. Leapi01]ETE96409.1 hypothetical protein C623_0219595 [Bacillus thuringiensis serovar aizawai str. Hu4-2]KLA36706.1 hypothetical protein B4158_5717 [Bacillus cereus]